MCLDPIKHISSGVFQHVDKTGNRSQCNETLTRPKLLSARLAKREEASGTSIRHHKHPQGPPRQPSGWKQEIAHKMLKAIAGPDVRLKEN